MDRDNKQILTILSCGELRSLPFVPALIKRCQIHRIILPASVSVKPDSIFQVYLPDKKYKSINLLFFTVTEPKIRSLGLSKGLAGCMEAMGEAGGKG